VLASTALGLRIENHETAASFPSARRERVRPTAFLIRVACLKGVSQDWRYSHR
jgi:hypothetical protein